MKLVKYDPLNYLNDEEDYRLALKAAIEEDPGDGTLVAATLGDIAKAKGMSFVAQEAGLSRESLYKALSGKGNPEFATILKVTKALGLQITIS